MTLVYFLKIVNKLLDEHGPHKTIKYSKTQYCAKPWITPRLASSIGTKNKLYKSFCKEKGPETKGYFEMQFNSCHNYISSLLRETKDSYYKQCFEDNKKILDWYGRPLKG